MSIFLHGDVTFRKGRVQKIYNVSEEAARKMIAQSDKERTLYYQTFADKEWPDARQYDISLDTSKIGLDKSVELIMKYLD
jgi:cytidylate kinase